MKTLFRTVLQPVRRICSLDVLGVAVLFAVLTSSVQALTAPLQLPVRAIAYDPYTALLYVTVGDTGTTGKPYGNSLIAVSAATAAVVGSVPVGSSPSAIALSPDAAIAWVGLNGTGQVVSVDLSTMTVGTPYTLGASPITGTLGAETIAVMPGAPGTIAVARRNFGYSPRFEGVAVYDAGIMRPTVETQENSNVVAFSPTGLLFGYDDEDSDSTLSRLNVDANGVSNAVSAPLVITSGTSLTIDDGIIYSNGGQCVEAATFQLLGTYQADGPMVIDYANNSLLFAVSSVVSSFDRDTFVPTGSTLSLSAGNPIGAAACGPACIAVIFSSGETCVLKNAYRIFADGFEGDARLPCVSMP